MEAFRVDAVKSPEPMLEHVVHVGDALSHVDAILELIVAGFDAGAPESVLMEALDAARLRLRVARTHVDEAEETIRRDAGQDSPPTRSAKRLPAPMANRKAVRR